jgi:uncharacterized lipoprotein
MEKCAMDIEEINQMWAQDCKIDEANLIRESSRIPELHNKYYNLFYKEALRIKKLKADLIELEKAKTEYYNGSMDELELRDRGWKPFALKVLRNDLERYVQSDKDIVQLSLKISLHEERAKYLESIVRQINNRNYIIKNIIDWAKFQAGG